jgi:hypothetical protein
MRRSKYPFKELYKEQEELKRNESDTLFQLTYVEQYRELKNAEVFGSLNMLEGKPWQPAYVYTIDDSIVAELNIHTLQKIVKKNLQ